MSPAKRKRITTADLPGARDAQGELLAAVPKAKRAADKVNHLFFARRCEQEGIPRPAWEVHFHPTRRWRADFAWVAHRLILELDGGLFSRGTQAHGTIGRMLADRERDNETLIAGWMVLRIPFGKHDDPTTFDLLRRAIASRRGVAEGERTDVRHVE
jgi:hypothetical protein